MERECVCGAKIDIDSQLCADCRKKYGKNSSEWQPWLQEWMKDYQRELDQENIHHEYALDERIAVDNAHENLYRKVSGDPDFIDVELDEWGNKVEHVDGFEYIDTDDVIACEKSFERHLRAIHNGYTKPKIPNGEKLEKLRRARLETHLYQDRDKY